MSLTLVSKVLIGAVVVVGVAFSYHRTYDKGFKAGQEDIQVKWDASKLAYQGQIITLQQQIQEKELKNQQQSAEAAHELAQAQVDFEKRMSDAKSAYSRSLLQSKNRAAIYQRLAQGGSVDCGSLASHTAELDRTLEQGRSLVLELRNTLELRDEQLVQVGNQLKADRLLFTEPSNDNQSTDPGKRDVDGKAD